MQDQGKRLIIAVALALGFMLVWQRFFGPHDEPKPKTPAAGSAGSAGSAAPTPGAEPLTPGAPTSQVGAELPAGAAVAACEDPAPITLTYPKFVASFSRCGAVLSSWHLTDERYKKDPSKGDLVPAGHGAFAVDFTRSSSFQLPPNAKWTCDKASETSVKCSLTTPNVDLEKTFVIDPAAFIVRATVSAKVKTAAQAQLAFTSYQFQDVKAAEKGAPRGAAARIWESTTLHDGKLVSTSMKDLLEYPRFEQNIQWTGFEHPFLLVGFAPKPGAGQADKHTYADKSGIIRTDIVLAPLMVKPTDPPIVRELVGYLGPKNYQALDKADSVAGFSTGFKQVVDFGWFGFIGRPLLWLLLQFYSVVGNWGIAIILLTILVKGATVPFTTKSMRSMKAMAALAPQMKALQEKYKGDRQRLQVETMALYKQHEVNPLSGCLPVVLQMPIWFALYRMLSNAGELYLQPFIPGWINDLTWPDHILAVILVVTMFAQARLNPTNPDPSQKFQQKFMQYGMPLMFGVMSFFFPSGLTLYIFTNTLLSAAHSIYMNKFDKKSLEIAAKLKANQAAVDAKKVAQDVKNAKDANPARSDDDDDDEDDDAAHASPVPTAAKAAPRPGGAKKRGKRGGRRR